MSRSLILYGLLCAAYIVAYAPYGVNETDGGFISGLAWQLLQGKTLYADVQYIRPPLTVWLRALEMQALPQAYALLVERALCYIKMAVYSYVSAAVFFRGEKRVLLAGLAFVVHVHCCPPGAWYTVDGLLFGSGAFALLYARKFFWAGLLAAAAMLCKQSFYPVAGLALVAAWTFGGRIASGKVALGLALPWLALIAYLHAAGLWQAFATMSSGALTLDRALEYGFWSYLRLRPELAAVSLALLGFALYPRHPYPKLARTAWLLWLLALIASYVWAVARRGEHTVPFSQSRLMFDVALALSLLSAAYWRLSPRLWPMLGLSWCAAISWGYNLPILMATPWLYAAWQVSAGLAHRAPLSGALWQSLRLYQALMALLIAVFAYAYSYGYRDGRRADMTDRLDLCSPVLRGLRTTPERREMYEELMRLFRRYPHADVWPYFPAASWIAGTSPPLPAVWVARRETNGQYALLEEALAREKPFIFWEKRYEADLETDPELAWVRDQLRGKTLVEEGPHFAVYR